MPAWANPSDPDSLVALQYIIDLHSWEMFAEFSSPLLRRLTGGAISRYGISLYTTSFVDCR